MGLYFDYDGEPIDRDTWADLFDDFAGRVVQQTAVDGGSVSTVWVGLDQSVGGIGPPLIYETLVQVGERENWTGRYPTWGAAIAGHDQIVAQLRDGATRQR